MSNNSLRMSAVRIQPLPLLGAIYSLRTMWWMIPLKSSRIYFCWIHVHLEFLYLLCFLFIFFSFHWPIPKIKVQIKNLMQSIDIYFSHTYKSGTEVNIWVLPQILKCSLSREYQKTVHVENNDKWVVDFMFKLEDPLSIYRSHYV